MNPAHRQSYGFSNSPIKTASNNQAEQEKEAAALTARGRLHEAALIYNDLIRNRTKNYTTYTSLAIIQGIQGNHSEAKKLLKKSINLNPNSSQTYYNLGLTFENLGDTEAAIEAYERAIEINPNDSESYVNLGGALSIMGNTEKAIVQFKKAIDLKPSFAEAHWNCSLAMLASGDYENGWEEYEWRNRRTQKTAEPHAHPKCKRWEGEELPKGTKLLLVTEQGLGDTIQFMRYAITLQERGLDVSICAQPKLHSLIRSSGVSTNPLSPTEANQVTDGFWTPLLSVPKHLGINPLNPCMNHPYIKVDRELAFKWEQILSLESKPIVGINWQGNPNSEHTGLKGRSLPLKAFSYIAEKNPNISLLSLQKGYGSEQARNCSFKNMFVKCQSQISNIWDFSETAAIIANCDLIITSDTAVAHLASGLGKPTWILLHKTPDWRWGTKGESTFWYQSARLFRQQKDGNWRDVMHQASDSLQKFFR